MIFRHRPGVMGIPESYWSLVTIFFKFSWCATDTSDSLQGQSATGTDFHVEESTDFKNGSKKASKHINGTLSYFIRKNFRQIILYREPLPKCFLRTTLSIYSNYIWMRWLSSECATLWNSRRKLGNLADQVGEDILRKHIIYNAMRIKPF